MAHWIWTVAICDGEEIEIQFENKAKRNASPIIVNNKTIFQFKEDCDGLDNRLGIIFRNHLLDSSS